MFYGLSLVFTAYAAWAVSDAFIKLVDGALPAYETVFYGAIFGLVALPFVKGQGERWLDMFRPVHVPLWLLRMVATTISTTGSVVAFTHLSMAEAFTLLFLTPTFVCILSMLFLKEQIRWRRWLAIALGFIGVLVVLRPGFRELTIGHLGAIISAPAGAVVILIFRHVADREKRLTLYSSGLFGPILICGLLTLPNYSKPQLVEWGYLVAYGLFAALGSLFTIAAARRIPASLVAIPQYSQMIWAIIFGYFLFHDHLDLFMGMGIALILCSSLLIFIREEERGVKLPRPVMPPEPAFEQKSAREIEKET